MPNREALLIVANDANIRYASGFSAPDPFIYVGANGRRILLVSDLEYGRAKSTARVDDVLSTSKIEERLKAGGMEKPTQIDIICSVLREHGADGVVVPADFGIELAEKIREKGMPLRSKPHPFFDERTIKSADEVRMIEQTQAIVEETLEAALVILRESTIDGNRIVYRGAPLTSEFMKTFINIRFLERNCTTGDVIVSCGDDACDPHSTGHGPLLAHQTIIFDIFPKSCDTHYYADMTRTFVKGRANDIIRKLYDAVHEAQMAGIAAVRDGIDSALVHQAVTDVFDKRGYKTGEVNGKMTGFIHGTGHGLGLDIHEPPRVSKKGSPLKTGHVVTVEPGLYYPGVGGIRLEDMVLVEPNGCRNLTKFPKYLEIP